MDRPIQIVSVIPLGNLSDGKGEFIKILDKKKLLFPNNQNDTLFKIWGFSFDLNQIPKRIQELRAIFLIIFHLDHPMSNQEIQTWFKLLAPIPHVTLLFIGNRKETKKEHNNFNYFLQISKQIDSISKSYLSNHFELIRDNSLSFHPIDCSNLEEINLFFQSITRGISQNAPLQANIPEIINSDRAYSFPEHEFMRSFTMKLNLSSSTEYEFIEKELEKSGILFHIKETKEIVLDPQKFLENYSAITKEKDVQRKLPFTLDANTQEEVTYISLKTLFLILALISFQSLIFKFYFL